jgi:15-cis-phytoene synthase
VAASPLIEVLPPLQRLALAYAPAPVRQPWIAVLALDARLAGILRSSREPMLAQLRFAWWREQLASGGAAASRSGDPLLAVLASWPAEPSALSKLVDGWEAMTGNAPLPRSAYQALAEARAGAFAALADSPACAAEALRMGRNWSLADIAAGLSDASERRDALDLARAQDWRQARLPRSLRPLAILHGLAARGFRRDDRAAALSPAAMLTAIRIGLLGR